MSHDSINHWIEQAKRAEDAVVPAANTGVQVIKRIPTHQRGKLIMALAERLRPHLMKMFAGIRGEDDLVLQPAHIRGMALNLAQRIVKEEAEATN